MGSSDIEDNLLGPSFEGSSPGTSGRKLVVTAIVRGADAQTSGNFGAPFFIADAPYEVISVTERHEVAGSDAGAVTMMLKKVPSGTAPGSGTDMLSAGISLKATANTNASGSLSATLANRQLAQGDALSLVTTGTLTAVEGVTARVVLRRLN